MTACEKAVLRQLCRAKTAALPAAYIKNADAAICRALLHRPEIQAAKTVFGFVGTAQEIDTQPALQALLDAGKTLCVPQCAPLGVMHAKQIESLAQLTPGAFGILEPAPSAQTVQPAQIDVALLPCVAAQADGTRLGQGGGYYDRYLPQLAPTAFTILLCRSALLLPQGQIPTQQHDIAAHAVLTEEYFYDCKRKQKI